MLFWNVLCSFVTHINELATSVKRQTTDRYDSDKYNERKDLAF